MKIICFSAVLLFCSYSLFCQEQVQPKGRIGLEIGAGYGFEDIQYQQPNARFLLYGQTENAILPHARITYAHPLSLQSTITFGVEYHQVGFDYYPFSDSTNSSRPAVEKIRVHNVGGFIGYHTTLAGKELTNTIWNRVSVGLDVGATYSVHDNGFTAVDSLIRTEVQKWNVIISPQLSLMITDSWRLKLRYNHFLQSSFQDYARFTNGDELEANSEGRFSSVSVGICHYIFGGNGR